ncbi:MAG: protein-L-isoaspartate(D-aspartate) O-methyltransferase [Candidatus Diapherotrites archaeon]|nr:protein-L-isoaspartate(D-aspartate) O-methyltransferase [Candidatus Diapherotrites archaeon]
MVEEDFSAKRKKLVEDVCSTGWLKSEIVKKAFLETKREIFFPDDMKNSAYNDSAYPIGFGQTISQPGTIALMLEMLELKPGQRVLEIGAGCGYVLALLSNIVGEKGAVFGVERIRALRDLAKKNLEKAECKNTELLVGNGIEGWKQKAPFDRILISAACKEIPKAVEEQLKDKGKLVAPIGSNELQELVKIERIEDEYVELTRKCCFVFVPLRN